MSRDLEFMISGNPRLFARLKLPDGDGPHPGVVLAHGYLSRQEDFFEVPRRLAEAGYAALSFDFRGHGRSMGARSHYTYDSHLEDLTRALDHLGAQPEVDPRRLSLVGHSAGTFAVLRLLGTGSPGVRGGALLAPPSSLTESMLPVEKLVMPLAAAIASPLHDALGLHMHVPYRITARDCYLDREIQREARRLDILQKSFTLANAAYFLEAADNRIFAKACHLPTLVVVAKEDAIIPNEHSRAVYDALATEDKEWVRLSPSGHAMMGDCARDAVSQVLIEWLARVNPVRS